VWLLLEVVARTLGPVAMPVRPDKRLGLGSASARGAAAVTGPGVAPARGAAAVTGPGAEAARGAPGAGSPGARTAGGQQAPGDAVPAGEDVEAWVRERLYGGRLPER
jgi:hypothetical protein